MRGQQRKPTDVQLAEGVSVPPRRNPSRSVGKSATPSAAVSQTVSPTTPQVVAGRSERPTIPPTVEQRRTTGKADAIVPSRTAPLAPDELVLIGLYRMVVHRDGEAAGDRFVEALHAELARLEARHARRQSRPVLAFSQAVQR